MTITINTPSGDFDMKYVASQICSGRREKWVITFDHDISGIPNETILKAAGTVSWLWMPSIDRIGSDSVIYSGYTD